MIEGLAQRFELWLALPKVSRALSFGLAAGTGTVLGLAAWLEPAAQGHGTHLQLGLGTCSFLQFTGQPCPMCGATTTFALMAHLRIAEAVVNQPFAVLLFVLTVGTFAVSVSEAIAPRARWSRILGPLERYEGVLASVFILLMGLGWLYKGLQMARL